MNNFSVPEKYRDKMLEIIANDRNTVHFIWDCLENRTVSLSRSFFEGEVHDPFEYMRDKGHIDETSSGTFSVYASQVTGSVISVTERESVETDLAIKFSPGRPAEMCHFYSSFLRGSSGKTEYVYTYFRPYSKQEAFNMEVLSVFTSDKAPQIFTKRIMQMMARHPNDQIAFIQFDIERFKLINENHGVETGDELLKFINDTLSVLCTEEQPHCRLTADVFMVVTPFREDNELVTFIRKLESMLSGYKGMEYRLIFGVAIADDRTLHTRRHGDNASLARQTIKGNALNNIGFYNGSMKNQLHKKQNIEDDMHKALLNNEFVMYLQPKHCISTGRIIGAEALARWIHPTKGMISPADFIPVFEENGFILKLDQFIWESACKKIRAWMDSDIEPIPISVNISREYVHSFKIVDHISELIKKYGIPAKLLELEITESIDSVGVEDVVKSLKEAGFTMLMDDFGSGYSSLNMLKTTPFDVLKIDRGFLSEFMETDRGRKIISHTISMSQDIGLDIVAEGVETLEQAKFLEDCGCDTAQGFYYSKPVPELEFDRRLREVNGVK